MKKLFLVLSVLFFMACIRDEAPELEADILTASLDEQILIRPAVVSNNSIKFYVNSTYTNRLLSPTFTLTKGASISPQSGTELNFSTPQTYVVTSESGLWKKNYAVEVISEKENFNWQFHFENIKPVNNEQRYHTFFETFGTNNNIEWASGNAGFAFTAGNATSEGYPTSQTTEGYKGNGLKLTTLSTGALGKMANSPLAAGNLFLGNFAIDLNNPAKSSHFGVPFSRIPKALNGYYKYQAGSQYEEKGKAVPNKQDNFDIYAVLFETDENTPYLDGTNVLTHPNIALIARIEQKMQTTTWTHFSLPFKALKPINEQKLAQGKYSLTVVFSSSEGGAQFKGAVGSTLFIDEVELIF